MIRGKMRNHHQNSHVSVDLRELWIPDFVFTGIRNGEEPVEAPKCPVLVFINTKSGGQLGAQLMKTFRELLNPHQLSDLSEGAPEQALDKVLRSLTVLIDQGDEIAGKIRKNLRLVVAGGDGTAGWLLGVMSDLRLEDPIPLATIPLGTGNNLPFSFGWGKKNPGTDAESVKSFLAGVVEAHPMKVDSWHLAMKMDCKDDLKVEAPHSLHVFKKSDESQENEQIYRGGFWNYFSIGKHHSSSRSINDLADVYVQRQGSDLNDWIKLEISSSIRALVLLNLPSFSGGLDPWGNPKYKKSIERHLTVPSVNDGLLEIVGFRDAWHGMFLLLPNGHGTRLAQAHRVRIAFKPGGYTFMRMDGEPWKQPLPEKENATEIVISHHGQAVMLARDGCIAEAKDSYQHVVSFTRHGIEHGLQEKPVAPYDSSSDDPEDEATRKFGAASTFRA